MRFCNVFYLIQYTDSVNVPVNHRGVKLNIQKFQNVQPTACKAAHGTSRDTHKWEYDSMHLFNVPHVTDTAVSSSSTYLQTFLVSLLSQNFV